jgi:hypothetical protein
MAGRILTREQLIEAGIHNLKQFGYPSVNKDNILTDMIYKEFFKKMLEDTAEEFPDQVNCEKLLKEINGTDSP